MLLLLLNYVVLTALCKIDVHLISTLFNKSLYHYYYYTLKLAFLPNIGGLNRGPVFILSGLNTEAFL